MTSFTKLAVSTSMLTLVIFLLIRIEVSRAAGTWRLDWQDEFNGKAVDTKKWTLIEDDGYPNELQYYRRQNNRIENGSLVMQVRKENYWGKNFTSGKVVSTKSWKYGKIEIRARLPSGKHLWPAFWMLPLDKKYGEWPRSGEIDIMEYRGEKTRELEGTLHYGKSREEKKVSWSGSKKFNMDFSQNYHIFGFQWDNSSIRWSIDRTEYFNVNLTRNLDPSFYTGNGQPFDRKFFLIFNLAVGGDFFEKNNFTVSDADKWEQPRADIDHVRVYQWQSV